MADFARESKEKKANPFRALVAENGGDRCDVAEILALLETDCRSFFGVTMASGISGSTVE